MQRRHAVGQVRDQGRAVKPVDGPPHRVVAGVGVAEGHGDAGFPQDLDDIAGTGEFGGDRHHLDRAAAGLDEFPGEHGIGFEKPLRVLRAAAPFGQERPLEVDAQQVTVGDQRCQRTDLVKQRGGGGGDQRGNDPGRSGTAVVPGGRERLILIGGAQGVTAAAMTVDVDEPGQDHPLMRGRAARPVPGGGDAADHRAGDLDDAVSQPCRGDRAADDRGGAGPVRHPHA
jgi:hypothetical protein